MLTMVDGDGGEWLTLADAAARFGVSVRSLRRAVDRERETPRSEDTSAAGNGSGNVVTTRQVTVSTKTGPRIAAAFPASLLGRLAGDLRGVEDGEGQSTHTAGNEAQAGRGTLPQAGRERFW